MRIAATQVRPNQTPQQPPQNTKPEPPKSDTMVEKIVDNTYLSANYAASGLAGAAAGGGAAPVLEVQLCTILFVYGMFVCELFVYERL